MISLFKIIIKTFIIIGAIILAGYGLYVATILTWSPPKNLEPHDAIIVLTGSQGRIETGFTLLLENRAPRLYISGVQNNTGFADLLDANSDNLDRNQIAKIRNHCCITLDYEANTTLTNADETSKWIEANAINRFILVTSAQHMPRAYMLFHAAIKNDIGITPYPHREVRRIDLVTNPSFWHYAATEYFKFAGSLIKLEIK